MAAGAAAAAAAFLFILLSLTTPSLALTCNPQPSFPNKRTYSSCTALPHLNATLHFTFDPANSSLSLAFSAAPPSSPGGGGWVAWAINPTSTGMIGAQALMALKSSAGSVVAKTFNISSYHSIAESKLSFDVWDLSADEASRAMRLFASVKVPAGSRSLNQVWQVGGAVDGTRPKIHDMADANKDAKATLVLAAAESGIGGSTAVSPAPAPASGVSRVGEASAAATAFLALGLVFLGSSYFGLY
ncbi:DOMON domain-containing protein [Psidium guajava]|nr:DOMON domain-containing protein [Psidium guajava]